MGIVPGLIAALCDADGRDTDVARFVTIGHVAGILAWSETCGEVREISDYFDPDGFYFFTGE